MSDIRNDGDDPRWSILREGSVLSLGGFTKWNLRFKILNIFFTGASSRVQRITKEVYRCTSLKPLSNTFLFSVKYIVSLVIILICLKMEWKSSIEYGDNRGTSEHI